MPAKILLYLIRIYKRLSHLTPPVCRFYPTCSEYAYLAIERYGALKGSLLFFCRILRCHPLSQGGYDPPQRGIWKKGSS